MASPQDLKAGSAYYRLTYADRNLTIPRLAPMIYLGVNIIDSETDTYRPVYTFQDTVSFFRFGSALEYKGTASLAEEGAHTYSFTSGELAELVDLAGAIEALSAALERTRSKGG